MPDALAPYARKLVLARPDQHVAWCGDKQPAAPLELIDLGPGSPEELDHLTTALDDHFGYNPLLGSFRQRLALGILIRSGDLERLVAWYSR